MIGVFYVIRFEVPLILLGFYCVGLRQEIQSFWSILALLIYLTIIEHILLLHRMELDTPWLSFDVGGYLMLSGGSAENNTPVFCEYRIYLFI